MSDLAALLHKEFITYEDEDGVPEPCSLCEARAARLEAAGVRLAAPRSGDAAQMDDDMCPNCVTPWKCNGPHEPAPPSDPAGYRWTATGPDGTTQTTGGTWPRSEDAAPSGCGAYHPDHPGTRCRQPEGHSGEHATARLDVTWDNAYLSAPDGITQRAHVACCWCGEHHEEGK